MSWIVGTVFPSMFVGSPWGRHCESVRKEIVASKDGNKETDERIGVVCEMLASMNQRTPVNGLCCQ